MSKKSLFGDSTKILTPLMLASALALVGCDGGSGGGQGGFLANSTTDDDAGAGDQESIVSLTGPKVDPDASSGYPVDGEISLVFSNLDDTFSLPVKNLAGFQSTVTVFVDDRTSHGVPDGTLVTFSAESGIIGSSCSLVNSSCSVNWTSTTADQPADDLVTVIARMEAAEWFDDSTGNVHGVFDDADTFLPENDKGDFYRDDVATSGLEANTFDAGRAAQSFIWIDGNGATDGVLEQAGNGLYNGPDCDPASTLCAVNQGGSPTVTVWRAAVVPIVLP